MAERFQTQKLIELRKLTRAVSELCRSQLIDYLATLTPLLRPRSLLGSYVQGAPKETVRGAERAFKDLQAVYDAVGGSKPFNLPRDLKPPIAVDSSVLEITPWDYVHVAKGKKQTKSIVVTSPLKWVLSFSGFSLARLREGLDNADPTEFHIQEFVLNFLVLHVGTAMQKGVPQLFEALRFPVSAQYVPELGKLPITVVSCAVPTLLPPDETVIESAEISGMNAFEEVVDVEAMLALRDPMRERLADLVKKDYPELLP
jgi:hypothetical protein